MINNIYSDRVKPSVLNIINFVFFLKDILRFLPKTVYFAKDYKCKNMKYFKWQLVFSFVTCLLMIIAISVNRDGRVFGYELNNYKVEEEESVNPENILNDGTVVISTRSLASDIIGYGGPIPLEIYIRDGRIIDVKALRNAETPSYIDDVKRTRVFKAWIGLTPEEALNLKVDAISGATYTSDAVIGSVRRGLQYASSLNVDDIPSYTVVYSPKFICALIVILMACVLPLFIRSKRYRMVQLVLNIGVLGFWCGHFVSYLLLVNYTSNGVRIWSSIIPVILLLVVFLYPLFGKSNHYCNWICPLGSLQEVAGKCTKRKLRLSDKTNKYLTLFREVLWALLMLLLWSGLLFSWMDYELFSAFMVNQTSVIVIVITVLFIIVSLFINRPYCRFVCPTGTLIKIYQNQK